MRPQIKVAKGLKGFSQMLEQHPQQFCASRDLCQNILLSIADEVISSGEFEIKIGNTTFPNMESDLSMDNSIIQGIMNSKPGTQITLLRDGEIFDGEYGPYDFWEVSKHSIRKETCKKSGSKKS